VTSAAFWSEFNVKVYWQEGVSSEQQNVSVRPVAFAYFRNIMWLCLIRNHLKKLKTNWLFWLQICHI